MIIAPNRSIFFFQSFNKQKYKAKNRQDKQWPIELDKIFAKIINYLTKIKAKGRQQKFEIICALSGKFCRLSTRLQIEITTGKIRAISNLVEIKIQKNYFQIPEPVLLIDSTLGLILFQPVKFVLQCYLPNVTIF